MTNIKKVLETKKQLIKDELNEYLINLNNGLATLTHLTTVINQNQKRALKLSIMLDELNSMIRCYDSLESIYESDPSLILTSLTITQKDSIIKTVKTLSLNTCENTVTLIEVKGWVLKLLEQQAILEKE